MEHNTVTDKVKLMNTIMISYSNSMLDIIGTMGKDFTIDDVNSIPILGVPNSEREILDKYATIFAIIDPSDKDKHINIYTCGGTPFRIKKVDNQ